MRRPAQVATPIRRKQKAKNRDRQAPTRQKGTREGFSGTRRAVTIPTAPAQLATQQA